MNAFTKEGKAFEWIEQCKLAFLKLKKATMNPLVLKLSKMAKSYEIWMDVLDFAIEPILNHNRRPLVFLSTKLENYWPTHEQKMHSIVYNFKQRAPSSSSGAKKWFLTQK